MVIENETPPKTTLYRGMADTVKDLIEGGTFREGDRLPSIRALSRQFNVSVNTAREAYWVLETEGLVESRPQSGYFVRRPTACLPSGPLAADLLGLNPHEILPCSLREDLGALLEKRPFQGLNLARGAADIELYPARRLNAFLGAVAREMGNHLLDYDTLKGYPELREGIAKLSLDAGVRLSPDELIVTGGCLVAIALALQVVCRAGDTIAVESPTYSEFLKLFKKMELRVLEIPTSPHDGMNLEVLEWALDRHDVKAVMVVPTYNNPMGFTMPDAKKKALVEILATRDIPLIEDDAYGDLSFLEQRPLACKAFDRTGNVIYCSSFSKTLAAGYRVGWVAGGRWHQELLEWKIMTSAAASLPTQMAVSRYLKEGNHVRQLRTLRRALASQSRAMACTIAESFPPGTETIAPLGGLFFWVRLPPSVDTEQLYVRAVEEGVFFRPGIVFSGSGKFRNCLRVCFGTWNPGVEASLRRLGALVALTV